VTPTQASVSDQEVSAVLLGISLSVEDDFRCPKSGYSIDMRVQDRRPTTVCRSMGIMKYLKQYGSPEDLLFVLN
jgi:hypothetical protein